MIPLLHAAAWPFAAACLASMAAGPVVKRLAIRFDFFDRPDGGLKPHDRPIPYLGGLAIYIGWLLALIVAGVRFEQAGLGHSASPAILGWRPLLWIAAGGTVLMLTGLIDDRRHLPPLVRLMVQAAVAGVLILGGIGYPTAATLLAGLIDPAAPGATVVALPLLSLVIAAIIIATASNSTNLIDGMDGLCAGVTALAAAGFFVLVYSLDMDGEISGTGTAIITILSAAVLGACLGFLVFNFNPASMFMGDSGSLLLGFSIGTVILLFAEHAGWRGVLAAATVFGFPIFDTALAVLRRWLNRKPLFKGDRSHFYDQLRDRGYSVRRTVIMCYVLQCAFVVWGVLLSRCSIGAIIIVAIIQPVVMMGLARACGFLKVQQD